MVALGEGVLSYQRGSPNAGGGGGCRSDKGEWRESDTLVSDSASLVL